jgi:cytochrome P450
LITLSGESWFRHRRVLTPAFHFTVLERYSGIFTRRAAAFAAKMKALPERESLDFMPHISSFVTGTVMETAFGLQDDSSKAEAMAREDFIKAADDAFQVTNAFVFIFIHLHGIHIEFIQSLMRVHFSFILGFVCFHWLTD